ncbi:TPA: DUF3168 domain-containing protein [Salmonella enterica subsp. enterica serovar Weltevreden]|nr:DUF3168 domain-containing protein [Salmonella enterica subsp. enterica serovar Weltevreden]
MRAGRALRRIIMNRLIEQVPALVGRVYDRAVEDTAYPYVTLGPSFWVDDSAECIQARIQTVQVDVWHSGAAKGALEDLVDDVSAALNGWDVDELTMHPLQVMLARIMDDPSGALHGVVQIEAMVEG